MDVERLCVSVCPPSAKLFWHGVCALFGASSRGTLARTHTRWQTKSRTVKQILNRTTIRSNKNLYHFTQVSFAWAQRKDLFTKYLSTKAFHALLTSNYISFFYTFIYLIFFFASNFTTTEWMNGSIWIIFSSLFVTVQSNSSRNPFKVIAIYILRFTSLHHIFILFIRRICATLRENAIRSQDVFGAQKYFNWKFNKTLRFEISLKSGYNLNSLYVAVYPYELAAGCCT